SRPVGSISIVTSSPQYGHINSCSSIAFKRQDLTARFVANLHRLRYASCTRTPYTSLHWESGSTNAAHIRVLRWIPPRAWRLLREWASEHQSELEQNWELARTGQPLSRILPLS